MALAQDLHHEMSEQVQAALNHYLAELQRLYPLAEKHARVDPWLGSEQGYLISIPSLEDEERWIELSEAMSEVATQLVIETDCLFVLTTLE